MANGFTYSAVDNKITVTGGTEASPRTFAAMYDEDAANGWGVVTEIAENKCYVIDAHIDIGDGSAAAFFLSTNELVYFKDDKDFNVNNNAVLQLGRKDGSGGEQGAYDGSVISQKRTGHYVDVPGSTLKLYASTLIFRPSIYIVFKGAIDVYKATINHCGSNYPRFQGSLAGEDLYINNADRVNIYLSTDNIKGLRVHKNEGVLAGQENMTLTNFKVTGETNYKVWYYADSGVLTVKNPGIGIDGAVQIDDRDGAVDCEIHEVYTVDITVLDKDGNGISGAAVTCRRYNSFTDEYEEQEFSLATDATGKIMRQNVLRRKWQGESVTKTEYTHNFTISKTGYETIELNEMEISEPADWVFELKPGGPKFRGRAGAFGRLNIIR